MDKEFLPEDYTVPQSSGYMKFKDGENTFRVLSSAIIGYEYWNTENKPVRSREPFKKKPDDIRLDLVGNPTRVKHFWAFVVWNYATNSVQILEITQVTIQTGIKALVDNKKWGDPKNYDICITRKGEGFDTEYMVMPEPHSELDKSIAKQYNDMHINLEALYDGENPFESSETESNEWDDFQKEIEGSIDSVTDKLDMNNNK